MSKPTLLLLVAAFLPRIPLRGLGSLHERLQFRGLQLVQS
jgi:hypothetical protein